MQTEKISYVSKIFENQMCFPYLFLLSMFYTYFIDAINDILAFDWVGVGKCYNIGYIDRNKAYAMSHKSKQQKTIREYYSFF